MINSKVIKKKLIILYNNALQQNYNVGLLLFTIDSIIYNIKLIKMLLIVECRNNLNTAEIKPIRN